MIESEIPVTLRYYATHRHRAQTLSFPSCTRGYFQTWFYHEKSCAVIPSNVLKTSKYGEISSSDCSLTRRWIVHSAFKERGAPIILRVVRYRKRRQVPLRSKKKSSRMTRRHLIGSNMKTHSPNLRVLVDTLNSTTRNNSISLENDCGHAWTHD